MSEKPKITCPVPGCALLFGEWTKDDGLNYSLVIIPLTNHVISEHLNPAMKSDYVLGNDNDVKVYTNKGMMTALELIRKCSTFPEAVDSLSKALGVRVGDAVIQEANPEDAIVLEAPVTVDNEGHGSFNPDDIKRTYDPTEISTKEKPPKKTPSWLNIETTKL